MSEDYGGWISTITNKKFYLFKPDIESVDINDIAHALSMICRFGGHTYKFYSVAQHSLIVSHICPKEYALEGLLHDATEAYAGDMVRPMKQCMPDYVKMENHLHEIIAKKFNLDSSEKCHKAIKIADNIALVTEKRDLHKNELWSYLQDVVPLNEIIVPWSHDKSKREFLKRFEELTGNVAATDGSESLSEQIWSEFHHSE